MTFSFHRLINRLPLRMAMPTVVVIGLVGVGLYIYVLRSVSIFADEQIQESLVDLASEFYDICDEHFTELMQSGKMDDSKAVRIEKAVTLGAIEDFLSRVNIGCRIGDANERELLRIRFDPEILDPPDNHLEAGPIAKVENHGKTMYLYHITFKPWGWHADLIKDTAAYAPLISRVKQIYIVTGVLLVGGLILFLLIQDRLFRWPLNRIISAVQRGNEPDYKGIYEFEFLAENISAMMRSLKERNQWIEKLYHIAITHRGQDYFVQIADALSEALHASTLIVTVKPQNGGFHPIAYSRRQPFSKPYELINDLPLRKIVNDKQAVIVAAAADTDPECLSRLLPPGLNSYAGIPIIGRDREVIGAVNVFGEQQTIDTWSLSLIKTVCQMVAVELELSTKERDRLRLEAQLQKSQKMEAIGTLAGGVAHDLNNILSGIVSYPDLLLIDLPRESPLFKPILAIKQSGERAATIVQDLLTLARRGVSVSAVVNLNTIIARQLKSLEFETLISFHPKVAVRTHFQPDLLNIKGSATHLAKSIMNLLSNAAEAMPTGGEIHIATENCYVDRPIRGYDQVTAGEYVTVTVKDTGIGISDVDKDHIFEPFYTKKIMGRSGTGLGMAVVWGTIKDHDGYIDLDSIEGRGTTFTLYFPVSREQLPADSVDGEDSAAAYLGNGETILVVDDVKEQRKLASAMLSRLNYTVTAVASGETAIAYLEDCPVDLLILDMIMGSGMDGLETYKKVIERYPGQKAIIASGFSETDRVKSAQRLGVGQYLKKPYTLEKIGMAVKSILNAPS